MKRFLLFISTVFLTFLSAGFTVPERLTIVELNTETLTVGNRELKVGGSFSSDQTIYWKSSKQAAEVQDNTGQLYIFTKEAFEQKNVKTPKEYLLSGKFSTRPAYDSPKIGRNKTSFPEKRVAMVIGNSNYISKADFLRAPIADAGMISEKLVDLGFDTYTICDASSSDLFKAVAKFSEAASKYEIALFYYAGHGFCYNHENYYQPVDVSDIDAATIHSCLKASELMRDLSNKATKGIILVMDACRSIAKVRGDEIFAPMEAKPGMMLFCSTSDGKAAIDAIGEYSPFAKAFSENLSIEGQPLYFIARKTMNDVRRITSGIQSPSVSDQIYEDFYFRPQVKKESATPVASQTTTSSTPKPTPTKPTSTNADTHEYVDLGLSVKWATCNLGASKPEEYGERYQWAGTIDVSDAYYLNYHNSPYIADSTRFVRDKWTKYVPLSMPSYWSCSDRPDNKTILDREDDAAHVKLGGKWRMPTVDEYRELIDYCTWIWTNNYNGTGVSGTIVTSKKTGYNDKSIFLPATGVRSIQYKFSEGKAGYYWSSSLDPDDPAYARHMIFSSDVGGTFNNAPRFEGLSVRPVTE